jgi:HNH endonuclease
MRAEFTQSVVTELLKDCHRRCCVCHRFCGSKMEIDHIDQAADSGSNERDNAIPVCFDCHAEIHSYNSRHPKGRKFTPAELRGHRDQWIELCRTRPEIFVAAPRDTDVGPLQALLNELEFNSVVSSRVTLQERGCLFKDQQFDRAIQQGAIWVLDDDVKAVVLAAYAAIGRANNLLSVEWQQELGMARQVVSGEAERALGSVGPKIADALSNLAKYLDFPLQQ